MQLPGDVAASLAGLADDVEFGSEPILQVSLILVWA